MGIRAGNALIENSLAKAFGAPIAILGGAAGLVEALRGAASRECIAAPLRRGHRCRKESPRDRFVNAAMRCACGSRNWLFGSIAESSGLASRQTKVYFRCGHLRLPANRDAAALHDELAA